MGAKPRTRGLLGVATLFIERGLDFLGVTTTVGAYVLFSVAGLLLISAAWGEIRPRIALGPQWFRRRGEAVFWTVMWLVIVPTVAVLGVFVNWRIMLAFGAAWTLVLLIIALRAVWRED